MKRLCAGDAVLVKDKGNEKDEGEKDGFSPTGAAMAFGILLNDPGCLDRFIVFHTFPSCRTPP
jgi:hypothetical protein